jgi:DNA-damage-inducible protein D
VQGVGETLLLFTAAAKQSGIDTLLFRHFLPVVERAREACRNSGQPTQDHFEDILDMVEIGSRAKR